MLALIAGTGDLPAALAARLDQPYLVCAMDGFPPALPVDIPFRIEHLGSFLDVLYAKGVTEVCMAGAIRRPHVDPSEIDAATRPLVPRIQAALGAGDDGALRAIIAIFEGRGFTIKAAHEIAPDLLPVSGVPTKAKPAQWHQADAQVGETALREMGTADSGQACVIRIGRVLAREGPDGTDAMLQDFHDSLSSTDPQDLFDAAIETVGSVADWFTGKEDPTKNADDGILFKGPKPNQDRRADLPVIGLQTAMKAAEAGLAGIVIEKGGVMVLDLQSVVQTLDANGMFLWVRPRGDA
jgi:DUF1009 family protein